jgi:hypothetical protein
MARVARPLDMRYSARISLRSPDVVQRAGGRAPPDRQRWVATGFADYAWRWLAAAVADYEVAIDDG